MLCPCHGLAFRIASRSLSAAAEEPRSLRSCDRGEVPPNAGAGGGLTVSDRTTRGNDEAPSVDRRLRRNRIRGGRPRTRPVCHSTLRDDEAPEVVKGASSYRRREVGASELREYAMDRRRGSRRIDGACPVGAALIASSR